VQLSQLAHELEQLEARAIERRRGHQAALARANDALAAGRLDEAGGLFQALLDQDGRDAAAWHGLARVETARHLPDAAALALLAAIRHDGACAQYHYDLGTLLRHVHDPDGLLESYLRLGARLPGSRTDPPGAVPSAGPTTLDAAVAAWRQVTARPGVPAGVWLRLGNLLLAAHRLPAALAAFQSALGAHPGDVRALTACATALEWSGESERAAMLYGHACLEAGDYGAAADHYRRAVGRPTAGGDAHAALARALNLAGRHQEAAEICRLALARFPDEPGLWRERVVALHAFGCTALAVRCMRAATRRLPAGVAIEHNLRLLLPIVYRRPGAVTAWRARYAAGLTNLCQAVDLADPRSVAREEPLVADQFLLAYQGQDDRPLRETYGRLVQGILSARYPEWARPRPMPAHPPGGRLRVGYLSAHMGRHTVGKLFLGWLQRHERAAFDVHAYHLGRRRDFLTAEFERAVEHFHYFPEDPRAACAQIVADDLHVLVFLDIGMDPHALRVAGLRLAPVQCAAWGHPVTTGLPTIDYFLSSDLMEPPDGAAHYSEQLVRLPGIGATVTAPFLSAPAPTRAEFGLPDGAIVYLSPQSVFKYLPQHDHVFVEIARRVPAALFVFLEWRSAAVNALFRERLLRAFARGGLDGTRHVAVLPTQAYSRYLRLNRVADAVLDTFDWSGGMTSLEALGCGRPIVTCPGRFMRGRHAHGILRQLGVTDTVAATPEQYVDIAARLGWDRDWRRDVSARVSTRAGRVFDDGTSVDGLETFLRTVVAHGGP
jgi:protein O-GlcNAc transferase